MANSFKTSRVYRFFRVLPVILFVFPLMAVRAKPETFSVNFDNTEIKVALQLIAQKSKLRLVMAEDVTGTISYSFSNVSLQAVLKQIADDKGLNYKIDSKGNLYVERGWRGTGSERGPASVGSGGGSSAGIGTPRLLTLKYLTTSDALALIAPIVAKDDRIIEDKPSNTLAYLGSEQGYNNVVETLRLFDLMPRQIYIEAHIVELNKNQSLDFGFSYGEVSNPTLNNTSGQSAVIANPEPKAPNIAIQLGLGKIDSTALSARLAAAELNGEAKILSRPKIVTINNKPADISSGITYSVRTLAVVGGGGSDAGGSATAGVTQVNAGLTLRVTPTIVGNDRIKLSISVSNSEPDETTNVDGIPGIINNSTNTEIIVGNNNTASVAGLVKATFAESKTGVPFLSNIPLIGWLFKSQSRSNRDKELIVFITPKIVDQDFQDQKLEDVRKHIKEVDKQEVSRSLSSESD